MTTKLQPFSIPLTFIGTYREEDGTFWGVKIEMSVKPAQLQKNGQTIDHKPILEGSFELSIMGESYASDKAGKPIYARHNEGSFGQIEEELRRVNTPRALRIAELWDRWHLNGLKPNCIHMPDQTYVKGLTCPETGYVSGTAWLYEPLPDEVVEELKALFAGQS